MMPVVNSLIIDPNQFVSSNNSECKDNNINFIPSPDSISSSSSYRMMTRANNKRCNSFKKRSSTTSFRRYKSRYPFRKTPRNKHGLFVRREQKSSIYRQSSSSSMHRKPVERNNVNKIQKKIQKKYKSWKPNKKKYENDVVREHINYFQAPHQLVPAPILPYLLQTGDYSQPFYYIDITGNKSIIFVHSGECTDSGQPRFVFIVKYDIHSGKLSKLGKFPCCQYFKACPQAAIDRKSHILHLFANTMEDKDKYIQFSLKTMSIIYIGKITLNTIPISYYINNQWMEKDVNTDKSIQILDNISSGIVLRDKWPKSNYKRYLYVPTMKRLLRFGGEHGVDDIVEYVDIEYVSNKYKSKLCHYAERGQCMFLEKDCHFIHSLTFKGGPIERIKWRKYTEFRLPGSALSMHFVLGYDHLLYIFDIKGGGNGRMWIIDLLFQPFKMWQALKSLDTWFAWDYGVKISPNYVIFLNAMRYGELLVSLADIMPREIHNYYDDKTKALVHGYCHEINRNYPLSYSFPLCLMGTIYSFYPPFF